MKALKGVLIALIWIGTLAAGILLPRPSALLPNFFDFLGGRTPDNDLVVINQPFVFTTTSAPLVAYKTSQNLLCDYPVVSITRAQGSISSNFMVGTTTATGTTFVTVNTKTLVTSTPIGTTTVGYFGPGFGVGTGVAGVGTWYSSGNNTTTFPWPFNANQYVLVYSDFANATSTTSTQPIGGYTLQGTLKIKCLNNT